ncbi:radical SAM protein [Thiohalorhabdus denitrificans]|uniref:Pyruvate formate lyase activating enzyme n=1 Tax=Thiohalorhabdus denitrificans TaxID=381306 RepID=A0A0P9CBI3_9GAMM|nr:AmmeMemoRadiSam system radical SAM enzyme [Thiohalorhabdus denitrificans]KPV40302.1 radical SAM protein [Thiohalorhabdus denitrificans]SCX80652.1 pyruvate formate lyase activating enzyme [Thiohalorhabdus denitrificans]
MADRDPVEGIPTEYWHRLEDGRIQCDLCPRFCRLHEGQRGLCFVRGRRDDRIVLTTYGRSSGFCVDPIEKKPLNHFLPGTPVLSFGTAGCNLACKFCQNWDMSKSREMDTLADQADPEVVAYMAERVGARSIAFTYNDPIIFHEYAIDIARACRERGIRSVAVSSGYVTPEPRAEFYAHMEAVNIDLKAFTERFYKKLTGSELGPVLDTIRYIHHETDTWMELTTLLIPGENDSPEEIERMAAWVREELGPEVPMHFTAFHPDYKMRDYPATSPEALARARAIALESGIHYAYTGNVHDKSGQSTYCHHCGELLIGREWYRLSEWKLDGEGRCTACGTSCAGVFEERPGAWGARRLPVRPGAFARELEAAG